MQNIHTRLCVEFIQSLSLHDPSLHEAIRDISLASILTDSVNTDNAAIAPCLPEDHDYRKELLMYGTPARRHLNPTTLQRLLEEVQTTLRSVTEFFHGGGSEDRHRIEELDNELPEAIERCKDETESLRQEIKKMSRRLTELIAKITQNHEGLDLELKQARTTTFPPHDVARSASVDLLAATIEASLIKLSLMKARSERTFYGHQSNKNEAQERCDVTQAISTLYTVLKEDEKHLKIESNSLDQQLQEYENLLRLVEGGNGGYQQVVKDWTKVKQETDECLKDLRRLGWTGD